MNPIASLTTDFTFWLWFGVCTALVLVHGWFVWKGGK